MSDPKRVVVAAPAKLNFCLHVGTRRTDGYHGLESLVAFAAMGDLIALEASECFSLSVDGAFAGSLDSGDDNLALRAARLLAASTNTDRGAQIRLTKNLPVASGLGGGSADAAAVLRGLVRLWSLDTPRSALRELAASLGADVPVCIESAPAWMEGKGERITLLPPLPPLHLLLVNPGTAVATQAVFATLRERRGLGLARPDSAFADATAFLQFLQTTGNDLEEPARAISPDVGNVLDALMEQQGVLLTRMSGSGATCFGIFETAAELASAASHISAHHPEWWVKETMLAPEIKAAPAFVQ
ncbi:MAG TPA: 4-(cytidine 5'-diphospho)-2-C-methyl-D-erythritol kinase [Rhizomicrobium sp.]|nr:4-(cytidine 5'-diphospho)-2-C-methyl-D-erythritol kinase [Rhizomicrobium sp.]